jgi:hypothetical protein
MKLIKIKKGIGQLYKVYQDQCKGYQSEEETKKANVQKLFTKLKLEVEDLKEAEDRGKWLKDRIDEKKKSTHEEERRQKHARIVDWREKMQSGIREVSKWLKGRKSGAPPVVEGCKSRKEATEAIKEHWKGVWNTKTIE